MKKRILYISERPSKSIKRYEDRSQVLNKLNKDSEVIEVYSYPITFPFGYNYPKNKKYKEYPFTVEPKYKLKKDFYNKESKYEDNDFYRSFDELIIGVEDNHTSQYSVELMMNEILGKNWRSCFNKIYINSIRTYTVSDFNKTLALALDNEENNNNIFVNRACIKYYFDYNYNMNANVFFDEILNNIIPDRNKNIKISKTMVLLLWCVYTEKYDFKKIMNINKLLYSLTDYKGNKDEQVLSPSIPTAIIQNLIDLNLINSLDKENSKVLTVYGEQFVSCLSKKTFDPDLLYRLKCIWMDEDYENVKLKIDKYITTIFTHQKRKNRKQFS